MVLKYDHSCNSMLGVLGESPTLTPTSQAYTSHAVPVRNQYKCLVPIYVFPEMKLLFPKQNGNVLSPSSYTHISVRDLYIYSLFCCREICGPTLGIYESLTDI